MTNKQDTFQEFQKRVDFVVEEENKLYKKYEIAKKFVINFPNKTNVPLSVKFASWFLRVKGGVLDIRYFDLK